jgi:cytochrome b pre-mRNA-processing protein 3
MLTRLKLWRDRQQKARSLYGSIVTQARSRILYAHWGVPDTAEGRFEMIALHLVLVLRRLGRDGERGQRLARALTETFAVDLDDNLREMTVGDLAVPRHVKRAVGALLERHASYGAALAAPEGDSAGEPLAAAVEARLGGLAATGAAMGDLDVPSICAYIKRVSRSLDLLPSAEALAGHIAWPHVDTVERDVGAVEAAGR